MVLQRKKDALGLKSNRNETPRIAGMPGRAFPSPQFALKVPVFVKYFPRGMHFSALKIFFT